MVVVSLFVCDFAFSFNPYFFFSDLLSSWFCSVTFFFFFSNSFYSLFFQFICQCMGIVFFFFFLSFPFLSLFDLKPKSKWLTRKNDNKKVEQTFLEIRFLSKLNQKSEKGNNCKRRRKFSIFWSREKKVDKYFLFGEKLVQILKKIKKWFFRLIMSDSVWMKEKEI